MIEDIYRLSPLQEGMLFESLYAPESDAYVVQVSWTLGGDLDPAALRRALSRERCSSSSCSSKRSTGE